MSRKRVLALTVAVIVASTSHARAQQQGSEWASAETVAAVSMYSPWAHPALILDGTATVKVGQGAVALVRPWFWRRPDGTWTSMWYQLQVRYQSDTHVPFRVDAGIIPSPLGLGTLEMRPDLNPLIGPPFYYVVPLPRFDLTYDGLQMISGGYPFGATVSVSGSHWDARGGVTSATPARARAELKDGTSSAMPQLILGGGITPWPGLRIGGGFGHGQYRSARSLPGVSSGPTLIPAADATVTNLEAEYAFGHSRVKGEWVWDRFETTASPKTATAFYVEGMHTFTPRWFGAARVTSVDAPMSPTAPAARGRASVVEANAGYRLSRDFTLRAGYYTQKFYGATAWNNQLCGSVVWARRWR
jgi:hypothetical protein